MTRVFGLFLAWTAVAGTLLCPQPTSAQPIAPVPAGGFWMGQNGQDYSSYLDETPAHWIEVAGFNIGRYEVTNAEYAAFLNATGAITDAEGHPYVDADDPQIRIHYDGAVWTADAGWETHPMREVSWYGANAYCRWAGGRLPTEAEWEKAARWDPVAGYSRLYPWGDLFFCNLNSSWWCNAPYDTGIMTLPVGTFPLGVSASGALDMAGNVWEWTTGGYLSYPGAAMPFADYTREVQRGGSWTNSDYNLRCAGRSPLPRYISDANLGFRVCFSAVEPAPPPIVAPPRSHYATWTEDFDEATEMDEIYRWWGNGASFWIDPAESQCIARLHHSRSVAGEYMAMIRRDTGDLFAPGDYVDISVRLKYERGDRDYARTSVGVTWGDDAGISPGGRGADENFGYPWLLIANNSDSPEIWHEVTCTRIPWGQGKLCIGFGLWGNLSDKATPPIIGQQRMWVDWVRVTHSPCTSGRGDFDGDCDVDLDDFGHFQACLTPSYVLSTEPGCEDADLTGTGRVDQEDFGLFQACLTGAFRPMIPECAER